MCGMILAFDILDLMLKVLRCCFCLYTCIWVGEDGKLQKCGIALSWYLFG